MIYQQEIEKAASQFKAILTIQECITYLNLHEQIDEAQLSSWLEDVRVYPETLVLQPRQST